MCDGCHIIVSFFHFELGQSGKRDSEVCQEKPRH
jgi:hypothetical protein